MRPRKTTITDDRGKEHRYLTKPFRTSTGFRLKMTLLSIVGESAGMGLEKLLARGGTAALLDMDVNLGNAGAIIGRLAGAIMEKGGPELIKDILSRTQRTIEFDGEDQYEDLDKDDVFERVYAANYVEMYQALYWVIEVNYGPFSGKNGGQWAPLSRKLKGLFERPAKTTATANTEAESEASERAAAA